MGKMTAAQNRHLMEVMDMFEGWCTEKYRKGVEEHGGNVWDYSEEDLIDSAIEEAIDQFVYLVTLRKKILGRE